TARRRCASSSRSRALRRLGSTNASQRSRHPGRTAWPSDCNASTRSDPRCGAEVRKRVHRAMLTALEHLQVVRLALSRRRLAPAEAGSGLVVSLTSHPSRIRHAWIAIETIFRQSRVPDRIVLVLGEDKFASRTLPRMLARQQRRGLEVLWVPHDGGSFDK